MNKPSMQALFDQLPPHSIESEMALLGSMILEPKNIDELQACIPGPQVFYSEAHAAIYQAMVRRMDKGHGGFDLALVAEELKDADSYREVGGSDYLLSLAKSVAAGALWEYHADIVIDRYKVRTAIDALGDALYKITRPGAEFDSVMPQICDRLADVSSGAGNDHVFTTGEVARTIADRIRFGEKPRVVPSGFATLDKMLKGGGFRRGQFVGIGGRPSNGKSLLSANLIVNASELGYKGAFISLEMDPEEIVERWLAFYGYSEDDARCELKHLELAVEMMENHDIPIIDVPNAELGAIRSHIRSIKRKRGLDIVAIDYLQLIRVAGMEREYEYVTHASKSMKSIAREYDIVNLCAFQLNRDGGKKDRPGMSDGKGSGALEQDMDTQILIHNPPGWDGQPEMILAKQRRGRTGTILVDCLKTQAKFVDKGEKTWTEEEDTGWKGIPI
jgi:replicative DNA helicase